MNVDKAVVHIMAIGAIILWGVVAWIFTLGINILMIEYTVLPIGLTFNKVIGWFIILYIIRIEIIQTRKKGEA